MANFRQEIVGKYRDVRLFQTSGGKDVYPVARKDGSRHDLADSIVEFVFGTMLLCHGFREHAPYRLKKAYVVPDSHCFIVRYCECERLREIANCLDKPILSILLLEDVLLRVR